MIITGGYIRLWILLGALTTLHAAPTFAPREDVSPAEHDIGDLMLDSWKHYFDENGGLDGKIFTGLTSWRSIAFPDEDDTDTETNQIIFDVADAVPTREIDSDGPAVLSYSQLFVNFVQTITEKMAEAQDEDPQQDEELAKAAGKQTKACESVFGPGGLLDEATKLYQLSLVLQKTLGDLRVKLSRAEDKTSTFSDWRDPAFIEWVQKKRNGTDFSPIKDCYDADTKFREEYNKTYGSNFDLFAATYKAIQPLINPQNTVTPGITMEIAEVDKSDLSDSIANNLVPEYQIPLLKGTLKAWSELNATETDQELHHTGSASISISNTHSASQSTTDIAEPQKSAGDKKNSNSAGVAINNLALNMAHVEEADPPTATPAPFSPAFAYDSTQLSRLRRRSSPAFEYNSATSPNLNKRAARVSFLRRAGKDGEDGSNKAEVDNEAEDEETKHFQSSKDVKKFSLGKQGKPQLGGSLQPVLNASAVSFKASYEQIKVVDINPGQWFDDDRAARAIRDSDKSSDPSSASAKSEFRKYYGSKTRPGNAAFHNVQILLVFHPSWEYTFASVEKAKAFDKGTTDKTTVTGNKVTYKDSGDHAFVVGVIQKPFWPQ